MSTTTVTPANPQPATSPDLSEIQKCWDAVRLPGEIVELRYRGSYIDKETGETKGRFCGERCKSPEELAAAVSKLNPNAIYWVNIQKMKQDTPFDFYGTLGNSDMECFRWFVAETDPERLDADGRKLGGVTATDAEKAQSDALSNQIYEFFKSLGTDPAVIDSGSGRYVLAPVALPNTRENCDLIKRATSGLQAKFSTTAVKIDTTAKNIGRVLGLPGTMNSKGPNTPERPHRMRLLLKPGSRNVLLTVEQLETIAAWAPAKVRTQKTINHDGEQGPFTFENVEAFFGALQERTEKDEKPFTFESDTAIEAGDGWNVRCPHDAEHSNVGADLNRSTSVWMTDRGFPIFSCLHDSPCDGLGWREFVAAWGARDLQCAITGAEPDDLPPAYVWSGQGTRPRTPQEAKKYGSGEMYIPGPIVLFDSELARDQFELRVSKTPGWAKASEWPDQEDIATFNWPKYEEWAKKQSAKDADDWTTMFHTREETENAPPVTFAIEGFLQEGGVTMLGGLAGHAKTLVALAMSRSLIEGTPLFGHFNVTRKADKVIYLIPESTLSPFAHRLKKFHLNAEVGKRFFYRTLSHASEEELLITDPKLLKFCRGGDVILDTAVRFISGDENASVEQKIFAQNLFALLKAGARSVTGLHHAPKFFGKETYIALENVLRGSGDIGAMLSTCWGLCQIDKEKNRVYLANCKAREFEAGENFIIEGRPSLDETGYFKMFEQPGLAGPLSEYLENRGGGRKSGRPEDPEKDKKMAEALALKREGMSYANIAKKVGASKSTIGDWFKEHEESQKGVDV